MIYFAYFIVCFTFAQLLVALINYLFKVDYTRFLSDHAELVSVIIPTRNESKHISQLLENVINQTHQRLEIIVVDDDSSDNTCELVRKKMKQYLRIQLMDSNLDVATNWLGKNHACYRGAEQAKGKYLLFLDADVQLEQDAIRNILGYFKHSDVVFLSVFPRQLYGANKVNTVIPLMNYILLSLLPLVFVRHSRFPSMAAANGQFMLFDSKVYHKTQPHVTFKHEKVEDIHIARFLKKLQYKIACLTGIEDINCHMYDHYEDAIQGFSKNVAGFFGNSYPAALLFWFITFSGIIWIGVYLPWYYVFVYIMLTCGVRVFVSLTSKQPVMNNILLHYNQLFQLGKLLYTSFSHNIHHTFQWKGRNISY